MNRDDSLESIEAGDSVWDVLIVGGGATGLGVAVDSASRGYRTLLLEASDFANGTSSRSTKLIHGGVRYLRQGDISLVLEALKERGRMRRNAPHLVTDLPFVVPTYDWWEGPFYGAGLRLYDLLAGREGFGSSRKLSREETLERLPTIEPDGLRGGVIYFDGQFDDARLAVTLASTATDLGANLVNYVRVDGLVKSDDVTTGVLAADVETGRQYDIASRVVINATGVFADHLRRHDDPESPRLLEVSQGIHIVLDRSFHPGDAAIMVPETDDGRVLFAIPWYDRVVVGTTDTPVSKVSAEPRALPEEVDFLLTHAARYLTKDPASSDVLSVFAGLRPLPANSAATGTAGLSRDHFVTISRSGLVTISGGKWTTYRRMAEDAVDRAAVIGRLPERPCVSRELRLRGWTEKGLDNRLAPYGADAVDLQRLEADRAEWQVRLSPVLPYTAGQVIWSVRHEMARTVDDVLARRLRALFLDARASKAAAPAVARLMATELGRDDGWIRDQIRDFEVLADGYILPPDGTGIAQAAIT